MCRPFYIMAVSAGPDFRYLVGNAKGGGYEWNQGKVGGKGDYIDFNWGDPIVDGDSGGGEGYV